MTPGEFDSAVTIYCAMVGGSETGGRRTYLRNILVNGVTFSPHRFGLGRDVILDSQLTPEQWSLIQKRHPEVLRNILKVPDAERGQIAERLGLRLVIEVDHDHLQPLGWKPG